MSGGLPVLTYHALDRSGSVVSTDPAWFAETLQALHESGFRTVDLDEWIAEGRPMAERQFALTFDDGLRSIRHAAGLLDRYQFRATAFLVTGRMGGDNGWPGQPVGIPRAPILDWSELDELQAAGFRFAAHTRTHRRLDRLDGAALDEELRGSRDEIEQHLGQPCRLLAYPYGIGTTRVCREAERHFSAAFGTRLDHASPCQDLFNLSRIDAYFLRSRNLLERLIRGNWKSHLLVRRTLRRVRSVAMAWSA
jgi:peptidoglycan/xylan/chitin deacetylase (PgdA/CDA1 family)